MNPDTLDGPSQWPSPPEQLLVPSRRISPLALSMLAAAMPIDSPRAWGAESGSSSPGPGPATPPPTEPSSPPPAGATSTACHFLTGADRTDASADLWALADAAHTDDELRRVAPAQESPH